MLHTGNSVAHPQQFVDISHVYDMITILKLVNGTEYVRFLM